VDLAGVRRVKEARATRDASGRDQGRAIEQATVLRAALAEPRADRDAWRGQADQLAKGLPAARGEGQRLAVEVGKYRQACEEQRRAAVSSKDLLEAERKKPWWRRVLGWQARRGAQDGRVARRSHIRPGPVR
jgi:hypothetical protein